MSLLAIDWCGQYQSDARSSEGKTEWYKMGEKYGFYWQSIERVLLVIIIISFSYLVKSERQTEIISSDHSSLDSGVGL